MSAIAAPSDLLHLDARAQRIGELYGEMPTVGAVRQRVGDLVAHVVAAHAAALERIVASSARPELLESDPAIAEVLWVHRPAPDQPDAIDPYGNRIEALLGAIEQAAPPVVAATAAQLAGEVGELYGATLERAFELLHQSGQGETIRAALDDDLIASLLVVHGIHPNDLTERVRNCLDALAETLPGHGGVVELVEIDADARVTVQITGGSELHRWRTRLAVERAIEHAAPDHGGIDVLGAEPEPVAMAPIVTFIPSDQIRRRHATRAPRRWVEVQQLADLPDGAARRVAEGDVSIVACNIGGDLYVTVDSASVGDEAADRLRLVETAPPTVETGDGRQIVFSTPLPVQRTDGAVEVMVP